MIKQSSRWGKAIAVLILVGMAFQVGIAAADCPDGKIEVQKITPSGNVTTICVSVNAQGGMETAADNSAGTTLLPSFTPLGDLPGGAFNSWGVDVSADGSVVIGSSSSASGYEAFRWTAAEGMVGLGDLPGGAFFSRAYDVSADGSVIVGSGSTPNCLATSTCEAYRWTAADGMVGLGDLPGGMFESEATGVSADGSVIAGTGNSASGSDEAFRWTVAEGMVGLGDLPGGLIGSRAWGVSADGSVVTGSSFSASGYEAFRWTAAEGMVGLGYLPSDSLYNNSLAHAISADGSVIVGVGSSGSGKVLSTEAFRWTAAEGMVGLGYLPRSLFWSSASDVSADGSVIVGWDSTASGTEAFRWTASNGMERIQSLLEAQGIDLTGWHLSSASGVSADGTTIVGYGTNPSGNVEAWIVTLPY